MKRREYREWCDKKRYEKEEEKIKQIKTEEAWKYINKYRRKREKIDEGIDMERWMTHFIELLGGTREKDRQQEEKEKEEEDKTGKNKRRRNGRHIKGRSDKTT